MDRVAAALAGQRSRMDARPRLSPRRQALLVLAHLHDNVTYTALARSFGIGVATSYRHIVEACIYP